MLGFEFSLIVNERSDNGTKRVSNFVALFVEVLYTFSREVFCENGRDFCKFAHQNEHILCDVIEKSSSGTVSRVGIAEVHNTCECGVKFAVVKAVK